MLIMIAAGASVVCNK